MINNYISISNEQMIIIISVTVCEWIEWIYNSSVNDNNISVSNIY